MGKVSEIKHLIRVEDSARDKDLQKALDIGRREIESSIKRRESEQQRLAEVKSRF